MLGMLKLISTILILTDLDGLVVRAPVLHKHSQEIAGSIPARDIFVLGSIRTVRQGVTRPQLVKIFGSTSRYGTYVGHEASSKLFTMY